MKSERTSRPPSKASASTCLLYLIRHAATENNLASPPLLQGQSTDVELSAEGLRQAAATAPQLAHLPISAVYSSPLQRATQTAEVIAKQHAIECRPVDALIEVDVGTWEGRCWEEIAQHEPTAYQNFIQDPAKHAYAGGESFAEVSQRTLPAFDHLMKTHTGECIVVIGHNVINRVYLAQIAGIPLEKSREIRQSNCGINIIRRRDGGDQLLTLNATFHLDL